MSGEADGVAHADGALAAALKLYEDGAFAAARDAALRALPDADDTVGFGLLLAQAERRLGRPADAVAVLQSVLSDAPDRADIWTLLGQCRRELGDRDGALSAFGRALGADPGYAKARYQTAVVAQEMGRHEDAAVEFRRYLETEAGSVHALAWSLLGVALRNLGRYGESAEAIRHAVELAPDDIPIRNALVITLHEAGEAVAAKAAAAEALALKDRVATARFQALGEDLRLSERAAPFDPNDRARNVISFSLWGDDPVYTHGAIVNAQIAPGVYPGWRCRFYCDASVPRPIIDELSRLGADVHLVRDKRLLPLRPFWRFLVSDDETVDRFICRDTDSRLNVQEAVAVDDWIKSGLPFHVMRDHVYHMEVMLAGLWGGVARVLPNIRALAPVAGRYRRGRWNDQEFLRDVVWPLVRDRARVHDSVFGFRGGGDFPDACRLPDGLHVGGAVKSMPSWPVEAWFSEENGGK